MRASVDGYSQPYSPGCSRHIWGSSKTKHREKITLRCNNCVVSVSACRYDASLVLCTLLNGESKLNNGLIVFWTPFLLWHLGSPHNITAYSLEDNDLWLRHFLGMVFLTSEAIYIYVRFQSDTVLNYMAAPIFVVGVFKYGERIWALRSASEKQLTNSLRLLRYSLSEFSSMERGYGLSDLQVRSNSQIVELHVSRAVDMELKFSKILFDLVFS
ncbi:hypothetical protein PTKIN_Ptkin02bG0222300 [Pterospermum kingtungense]